MFQYETVEQAVATRQALHGKRWPASNPKLLGVEFRNMEEVLYSMFWLFTVTHISSVSMIQIQKTCIFVVHCMYVHM